MNRRAVVLVSGGLDSATALAVAKDAGFECCALSVDYGQRHDAELGAAARVATHLGVLEHRIVPIPVGGFGGSALTDARIDVPDDGEPVVFLLCLMPAVLVFTDAFGITAGLGVNAVEDIQDRFGNWGLRFILITLAVTPLRQVTGWNWLARFRRMMGLFTFFYVLLHFLTWLFLDQGLLLSAIAEDIVKRPFITIGFVAFLLLIAMAVTSTNGMRRRLGRRWQQLHYGAYAVAILGVWHYWWQVKLDVREPAVYAAILAALLGYRWHRHRGRTRKRSRSTRFTPQTSPR